MRRERAGRSKEKKKQGGIMSPCGNEIAPLLDEQLSPLCFCMCLRSFAFDPTANLSVLARGGKVIRHSSDPFQRHDRTAGGVEMDTVHGIAGRAAVLRLKNLVHGNIKRTKFSSYLLTHSDFGV